MEKEGLETELNNYDDCRPKVLNLIIDFEKLIYERFPELKLLSNSDSRVGFTTLASKAVERGSLSSADMETLRNIRNSFSHNKYPEKAVVRISAIPEIAIHLLELFGEKAKLDEREHYVKERWRKVTSPSPQESAVRAIPRFLTSL